MSCELKEKSPRLWQMLSSILVSDPTRESWQAQYLQKETSKEPSEMMVDTEGFEATQASQTWDKEDEYWACDADGDIESSKAEGDEDEDGDGRPTKRVRRAGMRNSNLVQVVSDEFRTGPCKMLTLMIIECVLMFLSVSALFHSPMCTQRARCGVDRKADPALPLIALDAQGCGSHAGRSTTEP